MKRFLLTILTTLVMLSASNAQTTQTGSLRGTVTDSEGSALPGVNITVSGPSMMGVNTALTNESGAWRIPVVPPGTYTILAELSGFQKVRREGVLVRVGMTVTINLTMVVDPLREEITVIAPSPVVDVVSTKTTTTVTPEAIQHLPIPRVVADGSIVHQLTRIVPGVVGQSMKGGGTSTSSFNVGGLQANNTRNNTGTVFMDWDAIEEVEVVTGGVGVEYFSGIGGMINVVTKSGGNKFSGQVQGLYTGEDFSKSVVPKEKLEAVGTGLPESAISDWETSFNLGGPILKDKLWFMTTFRYSDTIMNTPFIPTTIEGKFYDTYKFDQDWYFGFVKISVRPHKNLRMFGMVNLGRKTVPAFWRSPRETIESNKAQLLDDVTTTFNADWTLSPNTFIEFRGGTYERIGNNYETEQANIDGPYFIDRFTGYEWGRLETTYYSTLRRASVTSTLNHFQDDFLGADHEIKAGVEYSFDTHLESAPAPGGKNGVRWDYYDGNRYYYRGLYGLDGPHPEFGDGRIYISNDVAEMGTRKENSLFIKRNRFSLFIKDTISIKKRLHLNLGLRLDTVRADVPEMKRTAAVDELGKALSKAYIEPVYGVHPFGGGFTFGAYNNAFPYRCLNPSIGISYDLFGDGKTALKLSYAKYAESLPTQYVSTPPTGNGLFEFRWWDTNKNGQLDMPGTDYYKYVPGVPTPDYMLADDYKDETDPDIKIPYEHQFMAIIDHELFKDFKISLNYTYKTRKREMVFVYYDRTSGEYWSFNNSYWVPFQTTVPAYGDFPATDVTVYYLKADHPELFYRKTNLPEDLHKQRYHSLELSFEKRMSDGWSLGGSFIYTDLKGNLAYTGLSIQTAFVDPNYAVNRYGSLPYDLPIMIKLYGSVTLPKKFILSFFFEHLDGNGWGRDVNVVAPKSWRDANNIYQFNPSNSVYLESPSTRRNQSSQQLDLRLEKEFSFGKYGRLGLFVDVFNVLGFHSFSANVNPGGTWSPSAVNSDQGTYKPGRMGFNTITGGVRTYKFSVRYTF